LLTFSDRSRFLWEGDEPGSASMGWMSVQSGDASIAALDLTER
jgi:hypothetical protein